MASTHLHSHDPFVVVGIRFRFVLPAGSLLRISQTRSFVFRGLWDAISICLTLCGLSTKDITNAVFRGLWDAISICLTLCGLSTTKDITNAERHPTSAGPA